MTKRKAFRLPPINPYLALAITSFFLVLIIGAIYYVQQTSSKNMAALQSSNFKAAQAFDVNNRLQELVTTAQAMQTQTVAVTGRSASANTRNLADTLELVQQQFADLMIAFSGTPYTETAQLASYLQKEIARATDAIAQSKNRPEIAPVKALRVTDDTLYQLALGLQKHLEKDLRQSFYKSNQLAGRASQLGVAISVLAILSIAVLGTLVVVRMIKQAHLITRLAIETRKANESARSKEQFLANMSHEIRTPINAVIGFTSLIKKTTLTAQQQEFAELIQWSGENLLSLVNDVLDMSKLEAGKMLFSPKAFSLAGVCKEVEAVFGPRIKEKNLAFSCVIDDAIPTHIIGDAGRLKQVLVNLIGNAAKFTEEGHIKLRATLLRQSTNEAQVQFNVTDTGIGIPKEKWESIFQRFEQADADTTREYGGTGLGLAIVKKIITLQGGEIWVRSQPAQGSDFAFTLRFGISAEVMESVALEGASPVPSFALANTNVLVVEDNPVNQKLVGYFLKQWHIPYQVAENGKVALQCLQANEYGLVLLDIQMPVMDGYTTAQRIREVWPTLPLIAMTANVLPGEKEKCLAAGMNNYISKPLDEGLLLKMIAAYLPADAPVRPGTNGSTPGVEFISAGFLHQTFNNDVPFIQSLLLQFKKQYPSELTELEMAIQRQQNQPTKAIAHNLKSTASIFGANTPLMATLDKIEAATLLNNWALVQQELKNLTGQKASLLSQVDDLIANNIATIKEDAI